MGTACFKFQGSEAADFKIQSSEAAGFKIQGSGAAGFKIQASSFKVAMLLELSFGESYP